MHGHCTLSTVDSRCLQKWLARLVSSHAINKHNVMQHRLQREARSYTGFHSTMEPKSADLASWEGQVVRGRINSGRVLKKWTAKSEPNDACRPTQGALYISRIPSGRIHRGTPAVTCKPLSVAPPQYALDTSSTYVEQLKTKYLQVCV